MVSIIVPVYNVEQYIGKCLDSCFAQSYTDIEVLAIDDGSSDLSGLILDRYASNEPRLKVFHQSNMGVVVARNIGIAHAEGEWLMFVDSDDYIPDYAVKTLFDYTQNVGVDIVVGELCLGRSGKRYVYHNVLKSSDSKMAVACALLTEKLQLSLCGKMFKASLLNDIETVEQLKIGEDAYMVIQLCEKARCVSLIDRVVYYYFQRVDSTTHRPSPLAIASRLIYIDLVKKFYLNKEYADSIDFKNSMAWFLVKECFAYIRMGGNYDRISKELREDLNNSLKNASVVSLSPFWRILMLRCYKISPSFGDIFRVCFIKLRLLFR